MSNLLQIGATTALFNILKKMNIVNFALAEVVRDSRGA